MKLLPVFLLPILVIAGCCESDSPQVKIDRAESDPEFAPVEHGDGSVTRKFRVGRWVYENLALRAGAPSPYASQDPFEDPRESETMSARDWPARKVLEKLDVPFPEDSEFEAEYDLDSEILTVRHESEWLDFVRVALDELHSQERAINLHFEIYEIPKALALRLEQSAGRHSNHVPEWEALQKIVGDGDAAFVTNATLRCRSGQRSFYTDGAEHSAFAGFSWDTTVEPPSPKPDIEVRTVGTVIEVDSILGPDNITVDLNLSVEHHTAPPTSAPLEVPVPGKAEPLLVDASVFHAKELITQITLRDGGRRLLCSWQPTGLPEFEDGDRMRIVFIRADVVRIAEVTE